MPGLERVLQEVHQFEVPRVVDALVAPDLLDLAQLLLDPLDSQLGQEHRAAALVQLEVAIGWLVLAGGVAA